MQRASNSTHECAIHKAAHKGGFVFYAYRYMKNSIILSILGVAVLVLLVLFALSQKEVPTLDTAVRESETAATPTISWEFAEEGEDEFGAPVTRVFVVANGNRSDLGTSLGSCSELSSEQFQESQVSGALCWWAGAGDEYGVFEEQGGLVVKKGIQEESTAESEGFRGQFDSLFML